MSSPQPTTVDCPDCGTKGAFTIWNSLNATIDPEKKAQLLAGELTAFKCKHCGSSSEVVYPMLYHDMAQRVMIYRVPGPEMPDLADHPFGTFLEDYRLRLVTTRFELVEKILIFDAEIDGQLLETFKASMMSSDEMPKNGRLFFSGLNNGGTEKAALEFAWIGEDKSESIQVEHASFESFLAMGEPLKEAMQLAPREWHRIDQDYAEALFRKYTDESSD